MALWITRKETACRVKDVLCLDTPSGSFLCTDTPPTRVMMVMMIVKNVDGNNMMGMTMAMKDSGYSNICYGSIQSTIESITIRSVTI